ncbi:MAG: hypothetical protein AAFU71_07440 [Cyanobacteria bacterium J06632_22]
MKTLLSGLSLSAVLLTATTVNGQTILPATEPNIDQVVADHQVAVCRQDWAEAERQVSVLMALYSVTPELRQELVALRQQYVLYRANDTQFDTVPGCASVVLPVEPVVEDEAPLVPLGSGFDNSFNNSFDGPPPPLSSLGSVSRGGIPVPPASNTVVIAGDGASTVTITRVYHRGNVVYGTLVNNTGRTVQGVQLLASLYDSGVGFAHAAQYAYEGAIGPGGRVEVPILIEGAGAYGEPGGILSNPTVEVWATGF